jgi:hypothetical protein
MVWLAWLLCGLPYKLIVVPDASTIYWNWMLCDRPNYMWFSGPWVDRGSVVWIPKVIPSGYEISSGLSKPWRWCQIMSIMWENVYDLYRVYWIYSNSHVVLEMGNCWNEVLDSFMCNETVLVWYVNPYKSQELVRSVNTLLGSKLPFYI